MIHCRRDPLDTCVSCYTQTLSPYKHPYAAGLGHLGLVYRQYERLMSHWSQVLDLRVQELPYEDLVRNQEDATRRILQFCGLEWDDRCLRYYETKRTARTVSYDQVRRPMYATSVGRHRHFETHLGPLKQALAG